MSTTMLNILGVACLVASEWGLWKEKRGFYRMTLPQIYASAKQGRLKRREPWRYALTVLGISLVVLSFWRSLSGV